MTYFGVDLDGRKLAATDTDVSVGEGPAVVTMTAREILLVVTGRRPLNQVQGTSRGRPLPSSARPRSRTRSLRTTPPEKPPVPQRTSTARTSTRW
jgi:hypothetical protein